jgi:hypothetical protein
MKQTAMQQHIEWLESTIEIAKEQTPILVNALKLCLNDAKHRLQIEKEQIIDAFEYAWYEWAEMTPNVAEQYYKETFKSE